MKTALPDILKDLGESEYTVLASTYCKLAELRDHLDRMHDGYLKNGTPPSLQAIEAARLVFAEAFAPVEAYVLALSDGGDPVCPPEQTA